MGVPSFYRWLVNKYPKVVANAIEAKGENNYLDTSSTNPNGIEFDNLYLDLNNIIHPCFHPEDDDDDDAQEFPSPLTFEQVFENMFKYIDRLFNIVRPRKLLYMAIDGVAPRAKMNQQRARRFRTAKDREIAEEEEFRVRRQFEMEGKQVLPKQETELSDSNIITPGTKFMQDLSKALKNYIKLRLSSDLGWRNIKVILSDANVPGEGEHKIMSFIRQQRKLPSYNPNTRHCLYGLDADLIMLALAVHEIHFSILREDVIVQNQQNHFSYKQFPHNNVLNSEEKHGYPIVRLKPYQFLHVWILREYLELDMQISNPPESFKFDIERIVDDFIFMCFFVGNDFLPHIPSLSIHEGAIDLLMAVYKKEMKNIGGYLVDMIRVEDKKAGFIKLSRVEKFILLVGTHEEKIFKKRSELRERKLKQLCLQAVHDEADYDSYNAESNNSMVVDGSPSSKGSAIVSLGSKPCDYSEILNNTKELKQTVKDNLRRKSDLFKNGDFLIDKVKLGSHGYKERYYKEKFCACNADEIESTRKKVVRHYTEGLIWVLLYYFSDTPSWTCAHALPAAYQTLMNDDSPIIDFYPTDFEIDVEGKRFSWQGVCKLPLIDESRLLCETMKLVKDLGVEESDRNTQKCDQLLVRSTHNLGSHMLSVSTQLNGITGGTCLRCADYDPPDCGANIPRLLDGVKLPEKMIGKRDLEDTEMWHEYRGMRPNKRYNNYTQNHMNNGFGSSKWGSSAGRGRAKLGYNGSFAMENPQKSVSHDHVVYKSSGTGWSSNGRGRPIRSDCYSKAQNIQTSGSCEKWKKATTPWGTPLTQHNSIGQPSNRNFWPSRNNVSSQSTSQSNWRQNTRSGVGSNELGQSTSKTHVSYNWHHSSLKTSDNSSRQAKGRGQSFHYG
ncbi:hypothetical protein CsatB_028371 [Cannabis sativa]